MFVPDRELRDFLLDARVLSRADLARIESERGDTPLFEALRARAAVSEDELTRAAAHILGISFIELPHEAIEPEALLLVPEPLARTHSLAVYKVEGHNAHVALVDTNALSHLEYLETKQQLRAVPHLTDRASLKRALLIHQKHLKERFASKLKDASAEAALDGLLSHALLSHASEIYLDSGTDGSLRVRYRIGGKLYDAMALPAQARAIMGLLKESAQLSFTLNAPQEGRFKVVLKSGEVVRVGVSTLHAAHGESMLLHLTREATGKRGFTLESLGLHGESLKEVHNLLSLKSGLVLVAAPQGHGKTTTLYTLLDLASHANALSISVEDHIEFALPHTTQVEIKKELGQTCASATRAALKHHPDILMIAEIKDEDTATLAASAASRGVLVFAGIKAPSASKAIQKMLTLGVDPLLLSATLRGAVGERVVRKLCTNCRAAQKLSRVEIAPLEERANFGRVLAALKAEGAVEASTQWKDVEFFDAKGCGECERGYKGTTALFEVLPVSAITKELIVDTKKEREEVEEKIGKGVPLNLAEDGIFKAAQGLTTIEEVEEALGA